jgi:S-formylglutathione hydrolase FrmB
LDLKGVKATYTEFPGYAHVWPLWRRNLTDFAPLLFKDK